MCQLRKRIRNALIKEHLETHTDVGDWDWKNINAQADRLTKEIIKKVSKDVSKPVSTGRLEA
jgi:hypothetical protein